MAETFVDDQYIQNLAQQRFPSLSADDAYLALHREIFIKYPTEAAKIFGIDGLLDVSEVWALLKGKGEAVDLIHAGRLGKKQFERFMESIKASPAVSQPLADNLTADARTISAQRSTRILKDLAAATPGPSNLVADSVETAAAGASLPSENMKYSPANLADNAVPKADTSPVPGESFLYRINYLECWNTALRSFEVAQRYQAIKALNVIADHLGDSNCIAVSGASGPDGFARPVYDLINKKINDIDQVERKNHRFFVYHDSTNWHPAFDRLTSRHPLPSEFVNKPGDNLDHMCLFMREIRQKLVAKDPQRGKAIVFHLLIPSWSKLRIKEPLHFPEDLYPLQIEGLRHSNKDQVELNLPAAPRGLLHGVANVLDPNNRNKIATGTSVGIMMPTVGWGVNGAFLGLGLGVGAVTGLGMIAAIPIWWGAGGWAMDKTAPAIGNFIYDSLREEAPRVLGSNERLDLTPMFNRRK